MSKMNPLVSVIIPHYNSPVLLRKLLLSIPKREEIQIIVVDDNSTKETEVYEACMKEFGEEITFLKTTSGQKGAGSSRNIGLKAAKGTWLLFADADDFFLDTLWDILVKYVDKEADMIFFIPTSIHLETGQESDRHRYSRALIEDYLEKQDAKSKAVLQYGFDSPWSKLIRRKIVEENQIVFDTTKVANDVMFSARCAVCAKEIMASRDTFYCITRGTGTLATTGGEENFDIRRAVWEDKYQYLKEKLSKEEWNALDMRGGFWIRRTRRNHYGILKVCKVTAELIGKGIRL